MKPKKAEDTSGATMLELFRAEAETQAGVLMSGLLELEKGHLANATFEGLMRAAHSLKGAARIVNLSGAVRVAHTLEDCFVAADRNRLELKQPQIDMLLRGVDLLVELARCSESELPRWETEHSAAIERFIDSLRRFQNKHAGREPHVAKPSNPAAAETSREETKTRHLPPLGTVKPDSLAKADVGPALESPANSPGLTRTEPGERVLRLAAENLNRLLGLAGESLVESRWLGPFAESLERLKRRQADLRHELERLQQQCGEALPDRAKSAFNELFRQLADAQEFLTERMQDLDAFDRRTAHLAQRLYLEVLRTRMRPFRDGVRRFPRMVRDLARALGKEVKLEISGESTQVDRDILERLETPLAHLLRNAVDHGCEPPALRAQRGKPPECCLRLEARHSAGVLLVSVSDDGTGVDPERVRVAIVQKGLASKALAERLSESDLLEFLFLPGFTLREEVTEISGRGFGLDIVQNMVKSVRGAIRVSNQTGRGLRVQLQLPLTLSVVRALLVEIGGEPYAIPLNQITRTLRLASAQLEALEGKPHFRLGEQQIAVVTAHQALDCPGPAALPSDLSVVVLTDRNTHYGLVVDRFIDERELVVQPLDPRLGEVKNISAAALMADGSPVLILDVEAVVRSIERLLAERRLYKLGPDSPNSRAARRKRVLAVDDSPTVRELERKLLSEQGYLVDVAGSGLEAWKALRSGEYDLVITDLDMPGLDGFELTRSVRKNPAMRNLPILILSQKECEQDRLRGLEAGANAYLAKGAFNSASLLAAVEDLLGKPKYENRQNQ